MQLRGTGRGEKKRDRDRMREDRWSRVAWNYKTKRRRKRGRPRKCKKADFNASKCIRE
jgi:hypothetical protein